MQVVVLDKLDYCSSLQNLGSIKKCPNFKVCLEQLQLQNSSMHASWLWQQ